MTKTILDLLKKKGYKLTPQRIEIVKILQQEEKTHPSLNHLYSLVKERLTTVSFSTLYNTISTLEEMGLIRLFTLQGETRVELNDTEHINIIDSSTGRIVDIEDKELVGQIKEKTKFDKKKYKTFLINILLYP
ncbi:MAG: Fur family transcriptional regulator [Candidatus Heimdallarchaeaceae archaeon]